MRCRPHDQTSGITWRYMPAKRPAGATEPLPPGPMSSADRLRWAACGWAVGAVASVLGLALAASVVGSVDSAATMGSAAGADKPAVPRDAHPVDLPIGWMFAAQWPLWLGMLGAAILAGKRGLDWGNQLGWRLHVLDIPSGAAVGIAMQLWVMPLLYAPIFWISRTLDWSVLETLGLRDLDREDVESPASALTDRVDTPAALVTLVVMSAVMAPLVEEVFFRGLLQGAIQDRFNSLAAVGGTALIFALIHFQPLQFPALLVVGAVHGLMRLHTERVAACTASHMAFNATTIFLLVR